MIAQFAVQHRADLTAHDDHRCQNEGDAPGDDDFLGVDKRDVAEDDGHVGGQCRQDGDVQHERSRTGRHLDRHFFADRKKRVGNFADRDADDAGKRAGDGQNHAVEEIEDNGAAEIRPLFRAINHFIGDLCFFSFIAHPHGGNRIAAQQTRMADIAEIGAEQNPCQYQQNDTEDNQQSLLRY